MAKTEEDKKAQIAALDAQRQQMVPLKERKNLLPPELFYDIVSHQRYELRQYCGSGSFGEVWLVMDAQGILVVLKIVNKRKDIENTEPYPGWKREVDGVKLYREKQRLMKQDHLVTIHLAEESEDYFYYTMDPADSGMETEVTGQDYHGETLRTRLKRDSRLTMQQIHQLGINLLDGLAELHAQGLVHRDLKPDNILIVGHQVKIGDYGLLTSSNDQVSCGKGTPGYLPPEEYDGGHIDGHMKDLYAVGKIIYCAASGYTNADFPYMPFEVTHTQVGKRLNHFLLKACSNNPRERFPGMAEFRKAFERCFESRLVTLLHQTWFWCGIVLLGGYMVQLGLSLMKEPKEDNQQPIPPQSVQSSGETAGNRSVQPENRSAKLWEAQNGRANLRQLFLFNRGLPAGLEAVQNGGEVIVNGDFLRWNAPAAGGELTLGMAEALPPRFEVIWMCQGSFAKMDTRVLLVTKDKKEAMIWLRIRNGSVYVLQEPFGGAMLAKEPPVTEENCGFINLHQVSYRGGCLRYWVDNMEVCSLRLSNEQQLQLKSCTLKLCFASQSAGSLAVRGLEVFELER